MRHLFFINLLMLGFILSMSSCGEDDVDDVNGCIDDAACNFNLEANTDDGSCVFESDLSNPIEITYIEDNVSGNVGEDLISHIHIQNNSCNDINLLVRKIFPASNASAYFCFNGICFPSMTIVAPNPLTLNPFEIDDYFKGYLNADSIGNYEVTYRFYLATDPTQSKEVTITYNVN